MFHLSIRPNNRVIVRNHYQYGQWGMEERYGPCQVKQNQTFEITILAEHQHYKIAVNGHHLGVFRHRLPLHLVQYVRVTDEVTIDHVLLEQDYRSVQSQQIVSQIVATPAMPYTQVQYQTPMQVHIHQQPPMPPAPPPYYPHQPQYHSVS